MAKQIEKQSKPAAAAVDPLEAAKMAAPPPEPEPLPAAPVAPPPETPKVQRYRVMATKRISLSGMISDIMKGAIVSTDGYAPSTIEGMRAAGVELEPIT